MKTEQIDGSTRMYAILGDPISAVRSPSVFNAIFAGRNANAAMLPLHIAAPDLETAWAGLKTIRNLDGIILTIPHKTAMYGLVDELGTNGRVVGAVNVVRRRSDGRWEGDMFDGVGCVQGLKTQGHEVTGRHVFLLGAGGAGSAIATALAQAGVKRLVIADVDTTRRDRVADRVRSAFPAIKIEVGSIEQGPFDIAINATPVGMKDGDPLPFDPTQLPATTLIVDVIVKPEFTLLLKTAEKTGHAIQPGKHMHQGQVNAIAEFFGFELDRQANEPSADLYDYGQLRF